MSGKSLGEAMSKCHLSLQRSDFKSEFTFEQIVKSSFERNKIPLGPEKIKTIDSIMINVNEIVWFT